jgi:hypothetical protein
MADRPAFRHDLPDGSFGARQANDVVDRDEPSPVQTIS